ncbi:MAG: nucleotidyltransferase domain-containing protein [Desulfomonile sp.]|jgi:predicted nucleotidyltransferase|nr:nucleotidyltransferase domain-containing protein [Deltaproteobacteria bacterium]
MRPVSIPQQEYGYLIPRELIDAVVKGIVDRFSPKKIILFGSYGGEGSPTPDSDLDLLVIMPSDLPAHKRSVQMQLLFRPMPCAMDIFVFTPEEMEKWNGVTNHMVTQALKGGIIVYEETRD